MKKNTCKIIMSIAFLALTIVFFIVPDNGIIAPSALVAFFLTLNFMGNHDKFVTADGKAARSSIITFSILVIILNVLLTIILPIVAGSTDLSSVSVELTTGIGSTESSEVSDHFVEVMINDIHELCYFTSILLLINFVYLNVFRRGKANRKAEAAITRG